MKESLKITGALTIVCIICAFLLTFVYKVAHPKIEINEKERVEDAINNLAPSARIIKEIRVNEDELIYKLLDSKECLIGYAFIVSGQGYQGTIKILAVIGPAIERLEGIEIVDSIETPGLGAKIQDLSFKKQFKNLDVSGPIQCIKDEPVKDNQIKAITGATVSSRAVVNILNKRIKEIRKELLSY